MSLLAGDALGPYEIVEAIGRGGMGEVYRARDRRLHRDVAIKVSTARFSQRFEREARTIAALNHPNVCTLFDVGPDYLVMELVEGITIADSLIAGPLPQDQALNIARQIAEALEAAHEHGIVHRDLKPSNIKIRPDGMVKVLDFGLAKQAHLYDAETDAIGPTVTSVGTIVGTAAYMSPEQATGHAADRRVDIWAFGVVLSEMLTGRRPFAGDTSSAVLANVIGAVPDLAGLPPYLSGVVEKCLRKDPRKRWQWIGDVRLALEESSPAAAPEQPPARARVMTWALASMATLFAIGFATVGWLYASRDEPPQQTTRFTVPIPGDDPETARFELSPNGRLLAIAASEKGRRGLWVRSLDSLEARLLVGTEGAVLPFWSAGSTQIGFFANGRLMRVPVAGGTPSLIAQIGSNFGGATWNADDVIVFSSSSGTRESNTLSRVLSTGGSITPIQFADLDNGVLPRFLDRQRFLFRGNRAKGTESGVMVGTLDDSRAPLLVAEFTNAAYIPGPDSRGPGRLLYTRARSLISQSFDAGTLRVGTDASTVVELLAGETGRRDFSVSDDGDLAYRQATLFQLTWVSRSGLALGEVGPPGIEWSPGGALGTARLSPDETKVAYAREHDEKGRNNAELWQLDLVRNVSERLTFFPGPDLVPVWSPNSREIVFTSNRDEATNFDPYIVSPGSNERPLAKVPGGGWPLDWSRDGRVILLAQGGQLWTVNADGTAPTPILDISSGIARISPDGKWLAYIASGSGLTDVYLRPFAASGSATRVSAAGGTEPQWRSDGRELYYVDSNGTLMAVPVTTDGVLGRPLPLFASANGYQASRDGQRFLVPRRATLGPTAITIVLNSQ